MAMKLYETMERRLCDVQPMDGQTLRFYCCGPTVYGPAHIGNFRTFALQDTLRRVLELGGYPTRHVRNLTDVDDKTIRQSQAENKSLGDFTNYWTEKFHTDCAALNLLPPHVEPSAVAHLPEQIAMIGALMEKGHAYAAGDGSVYFKIGSFPGYGRLSHLDTRELKMGTAVDSDEYEKEGVADFVLWKARKPEDGPNFWPSPWGDGRPGWHLECSAMSRAYLGDTFDLHSGGVDLIFPHHENEIAQSECCTGHPMSRLWFHINHLLVDGQKMSKSKGNLYTLDELSAMGHTPCRVRYVLLSGHYRTPLNFTLASLDAAKSALEKISRAEKSLATAAGHTASPPYPAKAPGPFADAFAALEDDLNTPEALGRIFTTLNRLKPDQLTPTEAAAAYHGLHFILQALGLDLSSEIQAPAEAPPEILALAQQRWEAKQARDWSTADALRKPVDALGWTINDTKESFTVAPK